MLNRYIYIYEIFFLDIHSKFTFISLILARKNVFVILAGETARFHGTTVVISRMIKFA